MLRSTDICPESCWLVRSHNLFGGFGWVEVALACPAKADPGPFAGQVGGEGLSRGAETLGCQGSLQKISAGREGSPRRRRDFGLSGKYPKGYRGGRWEGRAATAAPRFRKSPYGYSGRRLGGKGRHSGAETVGSLKLARGA